MSETNDPATIVSTANAEHYRWGGKDKSEADGWYLMRSPHAHVIEERIPQSASETRHLHTSARQFFYVLEGELTIEIERNIFKLRCGQGIEVAPGRPHQAMNHTDSDLRILILSQPPSHGDRIECPI